MPDSYILTRRKPAAEKNTRQPREKASEPKFLPVATNNTSAAKGQADASATTRGPPHLAVFILLAQGVHHDSQSLAFFPQRRQLHLLHVCSRRPRPGLHSCPRRRRASHFPTSASCARAMRTLWLIQHRSPPALLVSLRGATAAASRLAYRPFPILFGIRDGREALRPRCGIIGWPHSRRRRRRRYRSTCGCKVGEKIPGVLMKAREEGLEGGRRDPLCMSRDGICRAQETKRAKERAVVQKRLPTEWYPDGGA